MTLIISLIFILDGEADQLGGMVLPMLGIYLLIFLLFMIGAYIVLGNRYALQYGIDVEGISVTGTNDKGKDIRKLAVIAGVLSANPGLVGAGMLVQKDIIFIPWKDIDRLEIDADNNRVAVVCSFWKKIALHFPKEKEKEIREAIEYYSNKVMSYE